MPKADANANSSSIRRIAIDGHFLDEVQTRLHSDVGSKSLSYLSAPVERHHATEDEDGITLKLPAVTALQLFYDGVLSADGRKSVELTVAGRLLGAYFLHWMHTIRGDEFGGPVLLRFGRQPAKKEQTHEPNAWVKVSRSTQAMSERRLGPSRGVLGRAERVDRGLGQTHHHAWREADV